MSKHSEHYPTFIEHPNDPSKRAMVKTPYAHHRQLLGWGLEGLTPEPAAPEGAAAARPAFDPEYPKWIENPKTHSRKLVAKASDEAAQWEAWGIDPPDEDEEEDDEPITVGYGGPTPLAQIDLGAPADPSKPQVAPVKQAPAKHTTRAQRRAAAKEAKGNAPAGRQ